MPEETTGMMTIHLCMAFETYGIPWWVCKPSTILTILYKSFF
jgi:hypothetical protein